MWILRSEVRDVETSMSRLIYWEQRLVSQLFDARVDRYHVELNVPVSDHYQALRLRNAEIEVIVLAFHTGLNV